MIYTFNFGRRQLAVSFNRKRGRPKKIFINYLKDAISQLIRIGTDRRFTGHPVSRVLRRILEKKKTREIFGLNLVGFALLTGIVAQPISAFTTNQETEITAATPSVVQLTTEDTIRVPVDSFSVSQGYHFFHRAIDLNEIVGAPVYPIVAGAVEEVSYGGSAYGNYLVVDHDHGFKSLYAHLAKVVAAEGEEVDQNTVIGTVGTSGWVTGPHLHLEVYEHDQPFNPLIILK